MDIPSTASASSFRTTAARQSAQGHAKADSLALWAWSLLAALVVQLAVALWVLSDANRGVAPIATVAIALAAPIAGLVVQALSNRQRCAIWSAGPMALLWLAQTALLMAWHSCSPITLALVSGFGAAILLFVLCPMVIWPVR